jgi:large subunit ribosomal protein L3
MITSILGRKLGITQVYDAEGKVTPVTVIEAGPCHVLQVKTVEKDGYGALQLAFGDKREKRTTKPLLGVFKKAGVSPKRFIREVPVDGENHEIGEVITVETMQEAGFVDVVGTSKGRGFAGVVKRHHFHGQPASHGAMGHRVPGSIGSSAYPSRVLKGLRMGGHMGNARAYVRGLEVVRIDKDRNLLLVKGSVPGYNGSFVIVQKCADWIMRRKKKTFKAQAQAS